MFDAGQAATPIGGTLSGQCALVQRGPTAVTFRSKLNTVATAGAAFAVVYNNEGTVERMIMRDTDPSPIIGVMIGRNDGEALAALLKTNTAAHVRLRLQSLVREFAVTNTWLCEHLGVRIRYTHSRMGDLRATLTSPAGTVSVLHRSGLVKSAVPEELTYWTTHHFGESSAGVWTVAVSDEASGIAGTVESVDLILHGVPIVDLDHDGLDDGWELSRLGTMAFGAADDTDGDGWNNAAEQWMGTDPLRNESGFAADLSRMDSTRMRLSWPGLNGRNYTVETADTAEGPFRLHEVVPGKFPESGLYFEPGTSSGQFFRILE
jgi:subtilisin-like proprotein convertase family protein